MSTFSLEMPPKLGLITEDAGPVGKTSELTPTFGDWGLGGGGGGLWVLTSLSVVSKHLWNFVLTPQLQIPLSILQISVCSLCCS